MLKCIIFFSCWVNGVCATELDVAQTTCISCHQPQNIANLIKEREATVDFDALPTPDYALVVALGGTVGTASEKVSSTSQAFRQPINTLTQAEIDVHLAGDAFFEQNFSNNPDDLLTGLGPVFNDNSCNSCHPKDGRGNFSLPLTKIPRKLHDSPIFLRISLENASSYKGRYGNVKRSAKNNWGSPTPVPEFGHQLFHRTVEPIRDKTDLLGLNSGLVDIWVTAESSYIDYHDGSRVQLTKPLLHFDNPYDAPDDASQLDKISPKSKLNQPELATSPRMAMPVFGLGLIEAIPDDQILANVNSNPKRNDGITGKANEAVDFIKRVACEKADNCDTQPPVGLGRFGWKAGNTTLANQTLDALRNDMGVTNSAQPTESVSTFSRFKDKFAGSRPIEAKKSVEDEIIFYLQTLAVPSRAIAEHKRDAIIKGAKLFEAANCSKCHTPKFTTDNQHSVPALREQVIYPFSDFLLHDMGTGLADFRREFEATGQEWRTPPLWGIGKTKVVNPNAGFLHDGRAKTLEEAILWHGGEAAAAKAYFMHLAKTNREYLLEFLHSL